jgi:predicted lactoylglutathione lyase
MLHTQAGCQGFMPEGREIVNAREKVQMLPCLEGKSKEEVDSLVDAAVKVSCMTLRAFVHSRTGQALLVRFMLMRIVTGWR